MTIVRWSPFREMDDVLDRYQQLRGSRSAARGQGLDPGIDWRPTADVIENDDEYVIKAELPEVKREDVDVRLENGVITLSGERRFEKTAEDEKHHRIESFYGKFARSFSLPDDVDASRISAESKDGVLRVHLPKSKIEKPHSVKINVG